VDAVLDELTQTILMHIDAARLTMMDLALDHGRIGSGLDLEASYAIVVDVIFLKVALENGLKFMKYLILSYKSTFNDMGLML